MGGAIRSRKVAVFRSVSLARSGLYVRALSLPPSLSYSPCSLTYSYSLSHCVGRYRLGTTPILYRRSPRPCARLLFHGFSTAFCHQPDAVGSRITGTIRVLSILLLGTSTLLVQVPPLLNFTTFAPASQPMRLALLNAYYNVIILIAGIFFSGGTIVRFQGSSACSLSLFLCPN
ncbi:hypothetical protein ASPBRDRAFT_413672 [Aspergillus brasiliensis CBS 101740]|uniref:Uncharacterized protein n=1 Tax=Aspergillus brasiliensis (strain CBS 101740 / IMI 381727 / IBT 21946) TaxID=767769 RepID=A0A1L9UY06_ASPBC|nr:hypothetical protein ASPBRDRAFT_413672 [Aspergillus brasiliensis CBS 101740]